MFNLVNHLALYNHDAPLFDDGTPLVNNTYYGADDLRDCMFTKNANPATPLQYSPELLDTIRLCLAFFRTDRPTLKTLRGIIESRPRDQNETDDIMICVPEQMDEFRMGRPYEPARRRMREEAEELASEPKVVHQAQPLFQLGRCGVM